MASSAIRAGEALAFAAAIACAAGALGQPGVKAPSYHQAVVFDLGPEVRHPYGLAAADFLDQAGDPGQDGYPEIAVAGAGLDLFDLVEGNTGCDSEPDAYFGGPDNHIAIYHNRGAAVNWNGTDGPDPDSDPDDPHDALELVQRLSITAANEHMWAMEMVFADVTGDGNGPDLVLVGSDPDAASGSYGFLLVYKNLGTGLFDPDPYKIDLLDVELRGLVVADLDLDGDIDIAASASNLRGFNGNCTAGLVNVMVVFENITVGADLAFAPPLVVPLNTPNGGVSADITEADFAAVAAWRDDVSGHPVPGGAKVAMLMGKSDGTFKVQPDGMTFRFDTFEAQTVNLIAVDLDANGFDDIVTANHYVDGLLGGYTISVLVNAIDAIPMGGP